MTANLAVGGPADARLQLETLLTEATLSRASSLARNGEFGGACALLDALPETPRTLDLRARCAAQQGDVLEAERLWRRALAAQPDSPRCLAGLRGVAGAKCSVSAGAWYWLGRVVLASLVLGACVATLLGLRAWEARFRASVVTELRAALPVAAPGLAPASPDTVPELAVPELAVPGLRSEPARDGAVRLTLQSPAFGRGTQMTGEAKGTLAGFAQLLASHRDPLRVEVVGYSDADPMPSGSRYIDNGALSLARALTAVNVMRQAAALPSEMFSVRGVGEKDAPFGSATRAERRRNRTVALLVRRSEPKAGEASGLR